VARDCGNSDEKPLRKEVEYTAEVQKFA